MPLRAAPARQRPDTRARVRGLPREGSTYCKLGSPPAAEAGELRGGKWLVGSVWWAICFRPERNPDHFKRRFDALAAEIESSPIVGSAGNSMTFSSATSSARLELPDHARDHAHLAPIRK